MEIKKNITAQEYLSAKDIPIVEERNGEIIIRCPLNNCDDDSRGKEAHFYINAESGVFHCKKCDEKGNILTLAKSLGDTIAPERTQKKFDAALVEKCHKDLPSNIRDYLNKRGISDEVINARKLGYGRLRRNQNWITIPVRDEYGSYACLKLRQDPAYGKDKHTYPESTDTRKVEAQIYEWDTLEPSDEPLLICEGELDCLALISKGVRAITGTAGAGTFKPQWVEKVRRAAPKIYICYDNDEAGRKGALKVAEMIEAGGEKEVYIVSLPKELVGDGDVTDYLKAGGAVEDLFGTYAKRYPEQMDVADLKPITKDDIIRTLDLTIAQDDQNKLALLLCMASAFTDNDQLNVSMNAPSSSGKSYIAQEVAKLFPEESVMKIGYASPAAFYHDNGEYDKESNTLKIDFERKIIVFIDQPHADLLARLRPMLSHDDRDIVVKIADKSQKGGNKTKTVILHGYPAVVFCTAGLRMDEQESTRMLLLSPDINPEKIRRGVGKAIRKAADSAADSADLDSNAMRTSLKKRLRAIKIARIKDINVPSPERIEERFMRDKDPKPRHQRDVKKLLSFIKAHALLNLWWRERNGATLIASEEDIEAGFQLWEEIAESQELGVPPYALSFFRDIIEPLWREVLSDPKNAEFPPKGLTYAEILKRHLGVRKQFLSPDRLRQQLIPTLEAAGLITRIYESRVAFVRPTTEEEALEEHRESRGGVEKDENSDEVP